MSAVQAEPLTRSQNTPTASIRLPVQGMRCAGCAGRLDRALGAADGVVTASVNLASESAEIAYDPARTDPSAP